MSYVHYSFNLNCYSFLTSSLLSYNLYKVEFTLFSSMNCAKHRQLCNYYCNQDKEYLPHSKSFLLPLCGQCPPSTPSPWQPLTTTVLSTFLIVRKKAEKSNLPQITQLANHRAKIEL